MVEGGHEDGMQVQVDEEADSDLKFEDSNEDSKRNITAEIRSQRKEVLSAKGIAGCQVGNYWGGVYMDRDTFPETLLSSSLILHVILLPSQGAKEENGLSSF